MEELIMDPRDADWGEGLSSDCLELSAAASITGSDNLGGELLEGLDSYLDDINDRLTISRMVNDSVIKGMVNAIAQDAEERIKMKELQVTKLKEMLAYYHMSEVQFDSTRLHEMRCECDDEVRPGGSDYTVEFDRMRRLLVDLKASADDQFLRLQNDINDMPGYGSLMRIGSGEESVGLNSILHDRRSERWTDANKNLVSLKLIVENVFTNLSKFVHLCETSLREWKHDQHLQQEIEDMVIRHGILSLQESFIVGSHEHDNNSRSNNTNWSNSTEELLRLRQELDVLSKFLSVPDNGFPSHGSDESNDGSNKANRGDVFHRKTSLWEGHVEHDSRIIIPEKLEYGQFKHMKTEELFNFSKAEMIKMKRDHQKEVQEMTEEYFSLKRRAPSMLSKKGEEFDSLRKSVQEVLKNFDIILSKKDNVTKMRNLVEERRLDEILSENHHLKGLLSNTQNELKQISILYGEAQERIVRRSFTEMNLLKQIQDLDDRITDMQVEAAISEEVHKCFFELNFIAKDWLNSQMQSIKNQERDRCSVKEADVEDYDIEHHIVQELLGVFLAEAVKISEERLFALQEKSTKVSELQVSLQNAILEKENALHLAIKEKERLAEELNSRREVIKEKEDVILEVTSALATTKEHLDIVKEELNELRKTSKAQKLLISECNQEIVDLRVKLALELERSRLLEVERDELNDKNEYILLELNKISKERDMLLTHIEVKQSTLSLFVRENEEQRKLIQSMHVLVLELTKAMSDLECRVAQDVEIKKSRLEEVATQMTYLVKKCNLQRRTGLLYKQRLEKRCLDLQKAEAEVDLLGDEVEALLNLLEKIYIALDHYSPILKHYPGIVETLKLVRRKLGESTQRYRKHINEGSTK